MNKIDQYLLSLEDKLHQEWDNLPLEDVAPSFPSFRRKFFLKEGTVKFTATGKSFSVYVRYMDGIDVIYTMNNDPLSSLSRDEIYLRSRKDFENLYRSERKSK